MALGALVRMRMQRLLAERFQLAAHKETRQLPGLAGNFDFEMKWTPDAVPAAPDAAGPKPAEIGPALFIAVQ